MVEVIAVGVATLLTATAVQAITAAAVVRAFAAAGRRYRLARLPSQVVAVQLVMMGVLASCWVQVWLWAAVMYGWGLVPNVHHAFFVAASNFTTLGAEGTALPPEWKLLGPLQACNGIMMFGVASALMFAVKRRLLAGVLDERHGGM